MNPNSTDSRKMTIKAMALKISRLKLMVKLILKHRKNVDSMARITNMRPPNV